MSPEGGCQCTTKGNSQFTTFDGARFKLTSACSYVMASRTTEGESDCDFTVTVTNQKRKNKASTRLLNVRVGRDVITLDQGPTVYVSDMVLTFGRQTSLLAFSEPVLF